MNCDSVPNTSEIGMLDGWIPIGMEYPPEDIFVLVTDGIFIGIRKMLLDGKIKFWLSQHCEPEIYMIRFWMPLPELPK